MTLGASFHNAERPWRSTFLELNQSNVSLWCHETAKANLHISHATGLRLPGLLPGSASVDVIFVFGESIAFAGGGVDYERRLES
jgi:hypothetical protein